MAFGLSVGNFNPAALHAKVVESGTIPPQRDVLDVFDIIRDISEDTHIEPTLAINVADGTQGSKEAADAVLAIARLAKQQGFDRTRILQEFRGSAAIPATMVQDIERTLAVFTRDQLEDYDLYIALQEQAQQQRVGMKNAMVNNLTGQEFDTNYTNYNDHMQIMGNLAANMPPEIEERTLDLQKYAINREQVNIDSDPTAMFSLLAPAFQQNELDPLSLVEQWGNGSRRPALNGDLWQAMTQTPTYLLPNVPREAGDGFIEVGPERDYPNTIDV